MAKNDISDEDKDVFRQAMRDVKPIKSRQTKDGYIAPKPGVIKQKPFVAPKTSTLYLSDYYAEPVQSESVLSFRQSGLSAKQMSALKKGSISWQARLDLHGYRTEQAKDILLQFIEQAQAKAFRCLLLIHGKGGKHGEAPVLKNLVNRWLSQIPAVLAFHSAVPKDGGNGAVYVLLKRHLDEDFRE